MRFSGLRTLAQVAEGRPPGPEASVAKLFWSEYHKRLGEIAIGIEGSDGLLRPDGDGYPVSNWQNVFLSSRAGTIYSGTSEIQRNIIGERALGLPKEPRVGGLTHAPRPPPRALPQALPGMATPRASPGPAAEAPPASARPTTRPHAGSSRRAAARVLRAAQHRAWSARRTTPAGPGSSWRAARRPGSPAR